LPGYIPGWSPAPGGPSWALLQAFARYLQALIERVAAAPDRSKLAFLDMLGINLLPAQSARAPLVFAARPRVGDGRIPSGTRVAAAVAGHAAPLVFETQTDIALASANLAEVVTLWPGQDSYADHSEAAIGGQPFQLFAPAQPTPHALYLAHDLHFALSGFSVIEVRIDLAAPGSQPLPLAWEYWDGAVWRGFKDFQPPDAVTAVDSLDGTCGLTRSGTVRLVAECAQAARTKVNGVESYWVRGRATTPLPRQPGVTWPQIKRVGVRSVISRYLRSLQFGGAGFFSSGMLVVDAGYPGSGTGEVRLRGPNGYSDVQPIKPGTEVKWNGLSPGIYQVTVLQPGYAPFSLYALADFAVSVIGKVEGLPADSAYAAGQKLDLTRSFFPFGQVPQPGNDFYLSNAEAFARPGAQITLHADHVEAPQGLPDSATLATVLLAAEVWDGESWVTLPLASTDLVRFVTAGDIDLTFTVPEMAVTKVNGEPGLWMRIRIRSGAFTKNITINGVTFKQMAPPALDGLRLGYEYASPADPPQGCLTYNDFQWQDHTGDARRQGTPFEPFSPVEDRSPALYLGFDGPLPADVISLYLDVQEAAGVTDGPPLRWEYWDGSAWLAVAVQDETHALALPGMVSTLWPAVQTPEPAMVLQAQGSQVQLSDPRDAPRFQAGDLVYIVQGSNGELATVASSSGATLTLKTPLLKSYQNAQLSPALLPRFGTPRTWMRARLQSDGEPYQPVLNGLYLNAVWAEQVETVQNEVLGSSTAEPDQVDFTRQTPVLAGQVIEVRELDGPQAAVELPLLLQDLQQHGLSEADLRTVTDPRTAQVNQVWVRWQEQPNLFFSGPADRHYVIERSRGRVILGDNRHGRIPQAGPDNLLARSYRYGGGLDGNVPAAAISQLLSGVLASSVTNPRAAEGGADGETTDDVLDRGPRTIRNRRQALSPDDYEALAREASPAVAVARALPTTHPDGRTATGWVKVIIMPHSQDPRPQPSFELRLQVHDFLAARMPASMAGQVSVAGPDYLPVGVTAAIAPSAPSAGNQVLEDATLALQRFLHPLTGGPEGSGWPFGRAVYLSDVARVLQSVPNVDHADTLELTLDGTPRGEVVEVPGDRIVVAGPLRLTLSGGGS